MFQNPNPTTPVSGSRDNIDELVSQKILLPKDAFMPRLFFDKVFSVCSSIRFILSFISLLQKVDFVLVGAIRNVRTNDREHPQDTVLDFFHAPMTIFPDPKKLNEPIQLILPKALFSTPHYQKIAEQLKQAATSTGETIPVFEFRARPIARGYIIPPIPPPPRPPRFSPHKFLVSAASLPTDMDSKLFAGILFPPSGPR